MKLLQFVKPLDLSVAAASGGRGKFFLEDVSNSGAAVRRDSEGRPTGPPEDGYRKLGCMQTE
jgi:hypothetical protein